MVSRPYSFSMVISAEYWASVSTSERGALHVRPHHLMAPPLMSHLVRDHVEDHVDVIRLLDVGDEADGLRVRHGPGEGLGERGPGAGIR